MAYILATVQHETDNKFEPIEEYASGKQYEGNRELGNTHAGDGVKFKGRGFVQITGRSNYQKYAELTGIDLIGNPKLAQDPKLAAFILIHGFKHGVFTGRKLADYISSARCDFRNARRCINGTDRADLIAGYARQWLADLPEIMNRPIQGGKSVLYVKSSTLLKRSPAQSAELSKSEKALIGPGSRLSLLAYKQEGDHVKVTLEKKLGSYHDWWVYKNQIEILDEAKPRNE